MARLVIGVDVVGQKDVEALARGIDRADKSLQRWINTSSKASEDRIVKVLGVMDARFTKLQASASAAAKSLDAFLGGKVASHTAKVYGHVEAVKLMEHAYQSLIATQAKQSMMEMPGVQRLLAEKKAIEANIAAYHRLAQAGTVSTTYNRGFKYVDVEQQILAEEKLAAARTALGSGANQAAILAEEKLAAARTALGSGANQAAILAEEKLAAARTALGSGANQAAILAEEKLAAARTALGSGANQAAILAEEKLAAARTALGSGANQAAILAEEKLAAARTALGSGANQAAILAEEKLAAARTALGSGANQAAILAEEKLAAARTALGSGANQAAILAEEKLAAARTALGSGANQAAILAEEKLAAARTALGSGANQAAILAEEKLAAARTALGSGANQAAILAEEKLAAARTALGSGANQAAILAEEKLAAARTALGSGANQAAILAEEKLAAARTALAKGATKEAILAEERLAKARSALAAGSYAVSDYSQQGRDRLAAGSKAGGYDYSAQLKAEEGIYDVNTGKIKEGTTALNRLGDAWDKAGKKSRNFHDLMRGASGAMGTLWLTYGQFLPMLAGFAVAGAAIKSVQLGAEFDDIARKVAFLAKQMGETNSSTENIKKQLLDIKGVAQAPADLAKGLLEFSRAGVSAAEALKPIQQAGGTTTTILEQMSAMAYYSGENIEDLTKKVLGYSSAYGEQAIDVANSISKIADISNADIKDMLDAFKNATSLNTVVGASFHDVAAALGVMHDQGVKAATAGAALTTAVTKLIAPTKDVQKTFDLIDFSAKDVNTGKFKDLATLFRDLEKASSKLPENMRSAFLADSAGIRGLKFISSGIKDVKDSAFDGEEALKEFNTKLEKFRDLSIEAGGEAGKKFTYLQEVMEGMAESGKYNLDQLYASVKRLFIESYDNPSVVRAMKEFKAVVEDPATVEALRTIVGLVIQLLTLAAKTITISVNVVKSVRQVEADNLVNDGFDERFATNAALKEQQRRHADLTKSIGEGGNTADGLKYLSSQAAEAKAKIEQYTKRLTELDTVNAQVAASTNSAGKATRTLTSDQVQAQQEAMAMQGINKKLAASASMSAVEKVNDQIKESIDTQMSLWAKAGKSGEEYNQILADVTKTANEVFGPELEKAKKVDARLTADQTAGIKAENEALKQLRATITGYTNDAKDAGKTAKDWLKGNDSTLKNMEKLNKSFSEFSDFQPFTQIDYDANDMLAKYSDDLEAYKKEQEELPALIQATTDAYNKAKGARDGFVADLAANGAGSSQEDINQLHAYDVAVKSLEGHVDDLNKRHSELQNLQKSGIQNQEQLNAAMSDTRAFRMQMSAYSELGTVSKETYAKIEGIVKADVKKFEEATGDKLAATELLYQRMLKYQVAVAKGEEDIQGLMRAGLGLYKIKVDDDALEFYKDAMPQAIDSTADAMAQFSRDVMQGNATAADAWIALGDTVSDVIYDIIQDMIKLQAKTAIMGIGQSLFPSLFGSSSGTSGTSGTSGGALTDSLNISSWFGSAKGNVFAGIPDLSAYSNSIVTKPTYFAKGGNVMGEDGPEAIMPLTRGSDGYLGVRATSSPVTINVNNNAGRVAEAQVTNDGSNGKPIEIMIDEIVAGQIDRTGSKSNKALQRRGATSPLIRR